MILSVKGPISQIEGLIPVQPFDWYELLSLPYILQQQMSNDEKCSTYHSRLLIYHVASEILNPPIRSL